MMKSPEEIIATLSTDCQKYINDLKSCKKGQILVRGFDFDIETYRTFYHDLTNRKPLNSPLTLHNTVNERFEDRFQWKIRNGAFCYGTNLLDNPHLASLGYGTQYLFFPIGEYDFVYNPEHFDLYKYFQLEMENVNEIQGLNFLNDSLCRAMENNQDEDYSNEISIKTDIYYLVNPRFKEIIIDYIWV